MQPCKLRLLKHCALDTLIKRANCHIYLLWPLNVIVTLPESTFSISAVAIKVRTASKYNTMIIFDILANGLGSED